jgi:DNA repair protein RecO (recombination protein O)
MATSRSGAPLLGYVLHRYDWSETSLIVELLTRSHGRLAVVAKGAKRPTSQLRPVLLPFQPLQALLGRTPADEQGELRVLRSAEWQGGTALLDPSAYFAGFYLNELLLRLMARQDPHPALFDAYVDALAALAQPAETRAEATVLRAFELLLLRELGWLPDLALVTSTVTAIEPQRGYTLDAEAGLAADPGGVAGSVWLALESALAAAEPTPALQQACAPVAAALLKPLRAVLHYHLGSPTMRTRQVRQGAQRLAETLQR